VTVHNQRRDFHAAPPLLKPLLGLGAEAAMRVYVRLCIPLCVQMVKLVLLGRNLEQKALAQIPCSHSRGIKMLHLVNAPQHQVKSLGLVGLIPVGR
jgi:hypothetical protein